MDFVKKSIKFELDVWILIHSEVGMCKVTVFGSDPDSGKKKFSPSLGKNQNFGPGTI